jgi:transcriptional regulator with XRE-family HTH domain
MEIGTQLRRYRGRAGLSQQALADAAGTSQPTVAAYESGRVTPSMSTLGRLLGACGFTIAVVADERVPRWTRVEEKSLAIHRQIAARLLEQPRPTIAKARVNLDRLHSADRGNAAHLLDEWDTLLDRPTDEVVTAMLARTQRGIDLRQMTPFAGVLTDTERRKALRSVAATNAA